MARDNNINSAALSLERWLAQQPEGSLLLLQDVPLLAPAKTLRNLLALQVAAGTLKRLAAGVYYKPRLHPQLGVVRPPVAEIAEAIARRDGARIIPAGALALNQLGISTQIPMRVVYLTDGAARTVKLDKGEIAFRKANLKLLAIKGEFSLLAVLALKELRQEAVDDAVKQAIFNALQKEEVNILKEDMNKAPGWIQPYFLEAIKNKTKNT